MVRHGSLRHLSSVRVDLVQATVDQCRRLVSHRLHEIRPENRRAPVALKHSMYVV